MISVFVATSGRPKMFRAMMNSLWRTTQGWKLEVVAVIDNDYDAWDVAIDFGCRINFSKSMRGALFCWNEGLRMSAGDIMIPAGDDQLFHPNWLEYALESHQNILDGYGVVGMNDLAYNGNTQVATMWLFDRKYCKEVMGGIFAPPCYGYYNIDKEWNEKAKMLGKFYWDDRSVVEHLHSAHNKRPFDQHDQFKADQNYWDADMKTFEDRQSRGFPIEWDSII